MFPVVTWFPLLGSSRGFFCILSVNGWPQRNQVTGNSLSRNWELGPTHLVFNFLSGPNWFLNDKLYISFHGSCQAVFSSNKIVKAWQLFTPWKENVPNGLILNSLMSAGLSFVLSRSAHHLQAVDKFFSNIRYNPMVRKKESGGCWMKNPLIAVVTNQTLRSSNQQFLVFFSFISLGSGSCPTKRRRD